MNTRIISRTRSPWIPPINRTGEATCQEDRSAANEPERPARRHRGGGFDPGSSGGGGARRLRPPSPETATGAGAGGCGGLVEAGGEVDEAELLHPLHVLLDPRLPLPLVAFRRGRQRGHG